jgi:H+-transporting ATPase
MKANVDPPKAPESRLGTKPKNPESKSKPDSKDDLKSLPLPEVEKRLGSSPERTEPSRGAETAGEIWSE